MTPRNTLLSAAFLCATFLMAPDTGYAGDGYYVPLLVNMTPGPSDDAARECAAEIRRTIRRDLRDEERPDESLLALGESRMRQRMVSAGDASAAESDLFAWSAEALHEVVNEYDPGPSRRSPDTFILFDCQPTAQLFRVMVVPPVPGTIRIELHGRSVTTENILAVLAQARSFEMTAWAP